MDPLHLEIDRPRVIYLQIRNQVRELIASGQLQPGTKLPPTSELAAKWNAPAATVHAALSLLVKEGLLTRRPRIGTFVAERSSRLTHVGVYYDSNIWRNEANAFKRDVHVALSNILEQKGINLDVWFDSRSEDQHGDAWDDLRIAAEQRKIQALISTDVPAEIVSWQRRLPIPTAFFTYAPVPNKVTLDFDQFAETAVITLAGQGCTRAGLISILSPGHRDSGEESGFYNRFKHACHRHDIEVRPEWIRSADAFVPDESQETFGYTEFNNLWRRANRPDGLIVFPDTSVPGVLTALLENRVNVPEELRLVVHKHRETRLLCPLPVSFLYSSTVEVARHLFLQIDRQYQGLACIPAILPFSSDEGAAPRPSETTNQP